MSNNDDYVAHLKFFGDGMGSACDVLPWCFGVPRATKYGVRILVFGRETPHNGTRGRPSESD